MATTELANSLFLDFTSYNMTTYTASTQVQDAYYGSTGAPLPATESVNVAIVLPRANDPTELLAGNWASRQQALQQLNADGTLWSTYGADQTDYANAVALLTGTGPGQLGLTMLGDANASDGYVSSAASRTIWLQLSPAEFTTLFGQTPNQQRSDGQMVPLSEGGLYYWNGPLSLPTELASMGVGVWFDFLQRGPEPAFSDLSNGDSVTLQSGAQSIGNAATTGHRSPVYPGDMADWFYNFPLAKFPTVPTATVGLIEPGSADALPSTSSSDFLTLLQQYQQAAGLAGTGTYYNVANNGKYYDVSGALTDPGERSLDVGIIATASPGSPIGLYAGSGFSSTLVAGGGPTANAYSNVFTAFQGAFWDLANNPPVISASTSMTQQTAPGSPFWMAAQELFVDAALRNITVLKADNDFGSSWGFRNGLANQNVNASSPYVVVVGGTSLTTQQAAAYDPTVAALYASASANNLAALWGLVAGGLTVLPADVANAGQATFLEATWNQFTLTGSTWSGTGFGAGDGGVDTTQPTPSYQTDFGLTPTSANPAGGPASGTGRGAPDVTADAGGNMTYIVPQPDMAPGHGGDEGTSAAAPMWGALMAQIDTVFADQGLPNMGYVNDLLYLAAAIVPASFNDITYGSNVSSWALDPGGAGPYINASGATIAVTGYGYEALPGYDLVSGLGSPNGLVLARALSAVAHAQMYFGDQPALATAGAEGSWTSGALQNLLFQTMSADGATVDVTSSGDSFDYTSGASSAYAWTSRLAMQSLNPDFDPNLVRLFDKQGQGALLQHTFDAGEAFSLAIDGQRTVAPQSNLTDLFGFIDMASSDAVVRVARPVAIAETAAGADGQQAVVRVRQNGEDSLAVTFYRVDDYAGTIAGLQPGEAGYAAAAQGRAYQLAAGGTSLSGPGYGNYGQSMLQSVDAGDLIAMTLTNVTTGHTFWAFSQANETVNGQPVGHIWNYGLNVWGWEDTKGGHDHDFNDLVVQLDFTSASGQGWLV